MYRPVLDVPIYRISPDQHEQDERRRLKQFLEQQALIYQDMGKSISQEQVAKCEHQWISGYSMLWHYNEVVAWLHLYVFMDSQVRGELYRAHGERHRRGGKREFHWSGRCFETDVFPGESNDQIYQNVLRDVREVGKGPSFRRRFIDTSVLEQIGPILDWTRLVLGEEPI